MEEELKRLVQNNFKITGDDYAGLLDALKNVLLKMEEMSFAKTSSAVKIRIFSAVRQIGLGLLYHLPENSEQTAVSNNLNQKIRERKTRYKDLLDENEILRKNLGIVDSDIAALEKETAVLAELSQYEKIRSELMEGCDSQAAWAQILEKAATRVPAKKEELETMSSEIKKLLDRQKEILRSDLEQQDRAGKLIEDKIF